MDKKGISVCIIIVLFVFIFCISKFTKFYSPIEDNKNTFEATEERTSTYTKVDEEKPSAEELNGENYPVYDESTAQKPAIEVPYVGMSESKIADTSLGPPSDVGSNYEVTYNTRKKVTIYYFFENGVWIFCARCIDGRVATVNDYRNDKKSTYVPKQKTKPESDPYNANDYRNAEDFYDDHYYDFFDYYDAEKYYNEHTK